eukprot:scaffold5072_cov175-Prasinococcus_capsulatus_cf.AAC.1
MGRIICRRRASAAAHGQRGLRGAPGAANAERPRGASLLRRLAARLAAPRPARSAARDGEPPAEYVLSARCSCSAAQRRGGHSQGVAQRAAARRTRARGELPAQRAADAVLRPAQRQLRPPGRRLRLHGRGRQVPHHRCDRSRAPARAARRHARRRRCAIAAAAAAA